MLFIISASNSSMIVDMKTGTFYEFPGKDSEIKDLGEGGPEDFQFNQMTINNIITIPYNSFSPHHFLNDRFVYGLGNGRTGSLHSMVLGH